MIGSHSPWLTTGRVLPKIHKMQVGPGRGASFRPQKQGLMSKLPGDPGLEESLL